MRRLFVLAFLICPSVLAAKHAVSVKMELMPEEGTNFISARVENETGLPITFCVELGQRSIHGNFSESTPIPFEAQAQTKSGWNTLLIGPAIGSVRRPAVLENGKTMDFPFWLRQSGKFRLLLRYWNGTPPNIDCDKPPVGSRQVKSSTKVAQIWYTVE